MAIAPSACGCENRQACKGPSYRHGGRNLKAEERKHGQGTTSMPSPGAGTTSTSSPGIGMASTSSPPPPAPPLREAGTASTSSPEAGMVSEPKAEAGTTSMPSPGAGTTSTSSPGIGMASTSSPPPPAPPLREAGTAPTSSPEAGMVSEPKATSEPEADMVSEPNAEAGAAENQFLDLPKEKYIAARVAESQRVVQALQQLSVAKQKLETVVPDTKKKIHDRLEDKQEEIQDLSKELQGKKDAYSKLKTHQDEFILAAKKKAQKELQRANKSLQTADKIVRKKWARLVSYAVEFKCGNESARIVEDVMVAEEAHKCLPWCAERMPTMVTCLYFWRWIQEFAAAEPALLIQSAFHRFRDGGDCLSRYGLWSSMIGDPCAENGTIPAIHYEWYLTKTVYQLTSSIPQQAQGRFLWILQNTFQRVPFCSSWNVSDVEEGYAAWRAIKTVWNVLMLLFKVAYQGAAFILNLCLFLVSPVAKLVWFVLWTLVQLVLCVLLLVAASLNDLLVTLSCHLMQFTSLFPMRCLKAFWNLSLKHPSWLSLEGMAVNIKDYVFSMASHELGMFMAVPFKNNLVLRILAFVPFEVCSLVLYGLVLLYCGIVGLVGLLVACVFWIWVISINLAGTLVFAISTFVFICSGSPAIGLCLIWWFIEVLQTILWAFVMAITVPLVWPVYIMVQYRIQGRAAFECTKVVTADQFGSLPTLAGSIGGAVVLGIGVFITFIKGFATDTVHLDTEDVDSLAHLVQREGLQENLTRQKDGYSLVYVVFTYRAEQSWFDYRYLFGFPPRRVNLGFAPQSAKHIKDAFSSLRSRSVLIYLTTLTYRPESKTAVAEADESINQDYDGESSILVRCCRRALAPVRAVGNTIKFCSAALAGAIPCFDNYSDASQSINFLSKGQPFFCAFNILGIAWNVVVGLWKNRPHHEGIWFVVDMAGRLFQADVMEVAQQALRAGSLTRLFYEKTLIQASTENMMNMPVMIFAILHLPTLSEDDLFPTVGEWWEAHGFPHRQLVEFVTCFFLVVGNVGLISSFCLSLSSLKSGIGVAGQWVRAFDEAEENSEPIGDFQPSTSIAFLHLFEAISITITLVSLTFSTSYCVIYVFMALVSLLSFLPLCSRLDQVAGTVACSIFWCFHPFMHVWPQLFGYYLRDMITDNAARWFYFIRCLALLVAWYGMLIWQPDSLPLDFTVFHQIYKNLQLQRSSCQHIGIEWADFDVGWNYTTPFQAPAIADCSLVPWLSLPDVLTLTRTGILLLGMTSSVCMALLSCHVFICLGDQAGRRKTPRGKTYNPLTS
eukprot:TRINITY_DN4176_c0_g1_i9.p1 TRINITY_DN4176_c0_g1~~TRINITY_DN4176_c0_g1_i9.p1  ORF type:complete len:1290 (+),score=173.95 TRINITY_DN4176_c0_g1_i9:61-3930(+)